MKGKAEISDFVNTIETQGPSMFPSMSYEQGVEEALLWVLEEIPDDEFKVNFE